MLPVNFLFNRFGTTLQHIHLSFADASFSIHSHTHAHYTCWLSAIVRINNPTTFRNNFMDSRCSMVNSQCYISHFFANCTLKILVYSYNPHIQKDGRQIVLWLLEWLIMDFRGRCNLTSHYAYTQHTIVLHIQYEYNVVPGLYHKLS